MAVQQNKKSRSARDMRRSHDALEPNALSVEKSTGEVHLRHPVSPDGFYRGRKVIDKGADEYSLSAPVIAVDATGRAPCRVTVCKYVEISGKAVQLKQNIITNQTPPM